MNEAVWISGLAMFGSMVAIVVLGAVAGAVLYWLDAIASQDRH